MEQVHFGKPFDPRATWWNRYSDELGGLTATARQVLEADSKYILDNGVYGAGPAGTDAWPVNQVRTGLVMGSVQSGKTASMFGVAALALDRGIDIVVVLAGTRLSLWRQTYERLVEQLDAGEDRAEKAKRRLLCPPPATALSDARGSLQDTYRLPSAQVRSKLASCSPLIVVAMKQADHLYAFGKELRESVFGELERIDRPAHMLVLDDESDDGSVLDANVESGLDPLSPGLKQIPRVIADLWDPRSGGAPRNLFTTYVGYTATPQANLLQEDHNPLAPRDFVISLRTPLDVGRPVDAGESKPARSSTYPEPNGIESYYTGGEVYYERGSSAGLCVELTDQPDDDLGDSIRAHLVAGAIRLHWSLSRSSKVIGPHTISTMTFETKQEALAASPPAHSMLIHPAADIGAQFVAAEDLLVWAGVPDRATARRTIESGDANLPDELIAKMLSEQQLWEDWIDRYRASSDRIATEFNVLNPRSIPDWPTVRHLLATEVIPGTRIAVVNSDPKADDRPEYKPAVHGETEKWRSARDLSTIFISGNVMARGLTLEGMTTALFRRESANPFADTQMQMQRWFGYRGGYIELCRVFASRRQIQLFSAYHDVDEALREGIAAKMEGQAPSPVVLHGMGFLATGKIANLRRVPLCPSAKPFVTIINRGQDPDPNAEIVSNLFEVHPSSEVRVGDVVRGRGLDYTLSLNEAADFLSKFSYETYAPGNESPLSVLWQQVQARVDAVAPLTPGFRLYDAPFRPDIEPKDARLDCPYGIAAYLRLWEACLTRPIRGLFETGVPFGRWALADLEAKRRHQPRFSVGIRYGDGGEIVDGPLARLGFVIQATRKSVNSKGELEATWGTNAPNAGARDYRGDEFFDYYHRGEALPESVGTTSWRPRGSSGQILIYVNQTDAQSFPSIAVGICIPAGGPEQFAATRANTLFAP